VICDLRGLTFSWVDREAEKKERENNKGKQRETKGNKEEGKKREAERKRERYNPDSVDMTLTSNICGVTFMTSAIRTGHAAWFVRAYAPIHNKIFLFRLVFFSRCVSTLLTLFSLLLLQLYASSAIFPFLITCSLDLIYNILGEWLFISFSGFIHEMIFFLEFLNKYFLFMIASQSLWYVITLVIDYFKESSYLWLYMTICLRNCIIDINSKKIFDKLTFNQHQQSTLYA